MENKDEKTFTKILSLILALIMISGFTACKDKGTNQQPSIEDNTKQEEEKKEEPEDLTAKLTLTSEELPVIDGATAMLPYYEEMVARICGISSEEASKLVLCNTTAQAYPNLYEKKADLIFCAPPSDEQIEEAKNCGVEYESVQVLNSGFVFFVNKSNPVDNLSSQQLHDIYAGKITNWKEVGGNDEEIIAYQRSEGSGSQTGLYQHVIPKSEAAEPLTEQKIGVMSEIIDAVANYDNASGAIGYSYYYYVTNMHYQEDVKLISIDNVYPNEETISYDIYPYISKTCAIFRSDEPEDSVVRKLAAWCSGSAGKKMSVDLGYVPSGNSRVIVSGYDDYKLHEPTYFYRENNISVERIAKTAENGFGYSYEISSYVQISGLKDEKVQQSINDAIKAVYDKYTDESYAPEGKSLRGLADSSGGSRTFSVYPQFNGNNILSLFFTFYFSKEENGDYFNSTEEIAMTFDLNTGKQLRLADLFNDSRNGISYLNSTLFDMINDNNLYEEDAEGYYDSIRLVKAFDGLKDDQAFYISPNGLLWLIFDSKTPEFYVDYGDCTSLSFDVRQIVDFDKYMGKKALFASEDVPVYHFMQGNFEGNEIHPDIKAKLWEMVGSRSIYITNYSSLYDSLTPAQLKAMSFDEDYLTSVLETLIRTYDEEIEKGGKYVYGNLSFNSYPSVIGNYLTISKYFNANVEVSTDNDYVSIPVAGETAYYNFRNGKDEALSLEDIFLEGTDIRDVLKSAMYKELENSQTWLDTSIGAIESLVDYAVDNISGFQIDLDHLSFNIPGLQEKFTECLADSGYSEFYDFSYSEFYDFSSCVCYVDYRYIGCENLSIFQ